MQLVLWLRLENNIEIFGFSAVSVNIPLIADN